jgi:hypothetical protein
VIACCLAPLGIGDLTIRGQDKDAAQLPRVALELRLAVSSPVCAQARGQHPGSTQSTEAALQGHGAIRCSRWVRQEEDGLWVSACELIEEGHSPIAHHHNMTPELLDLRFSLQDLSNLLTTEDSAEVPDENQHCGSRCPAGIEGNGPPFSIKDLDSSECFHRIVSWRRGGGRAVDRRRRSERL